MSDAPLVAIRNVTMNYGHVHALRGVDFELVRGETHAIVGDNGAGKSTLAKIIAGAIKPSSGHIEIQGRQVAFDSPRDAFDQGIATVYQNLALVGCRDIAENIFLGREPTRHGYVQRRLMHKQAKEIIAALRQMNVADTHVRVSDLSGGQRQAVAIAREIGLGSRILLLDEPTAALGVRESEEVLNMVGSLRSEEGGIVVISHNLAHLFRISDRITVLRGGLRVATLPVVGTAPEEIVHLITGGTWN